MKEKQIEEMTKDLKENLRLCVGVKLLDYQVETVAYELSKKYQPKLPEHSVVLTREEYQKDFSSQFNKGYKHGSKETAESFRDKAKYLIEERSGIQGCDLEDISIDGAIIVEVLDELSKQFGIEIKE